MEIKSQNNFQKNPSLNTTGQNLQNLPQDTFAIHQNSSAPTMPQAVDVVSLSASALKAYFASINNDKNILPTTRNINLGILQINNSYDALQINGSLNKIINNSDLGNVLLNGQSNQMILNGKIEDLLVVGSKNKLNTNQEMKAILVGDSNQILANNTAKLEVTIKGSSNNIVGSTQQDISIINGNINHISLGLGDDVAIIKGNNNKVDMGSGNDTVLADGKNYNITLGDGNDAISAYGSGIIKADDGNDLIDVYGTKNTINGGNGDDVFTIYNSDNTLKGDDGNDTFAIKFLEGNITIDGGNGTDTIQLDFNKDDYISIASDKNITFYLKENLNKKLSIHFSSTEFLKFKNGETLSIDEVKNLKGLSYQLPENSSKSIIKNASPYVNVLDLNIPIGSFIKSVKTASGLKVTYRNQANQQKNVELQNFKFLKIGDSYIDTKETPNISFLNFDIKDSRVITTEVNKTTSQTKFYDKTTENLMSTITYNLTTDGFLFSNGTYLKGNQLKDFIIGKSIDADFNTSSITPSSSLTNTVNLKFDADRIYQIEKTNLNSYVLKFKKDDQSTGSISLNNISYLSTNKNEVLSLSQIYQNISTIRNNEKSRILYTSMQQSTDFRRVLYNMTNNISYLDSLIGNNYAELNESEKSKIKNHAIQLETSLSFASDYLNKTVDDATKKIFTMRIANLLKNREDIIEQLKNTELKISFSRDSDLGGTANSFITGYATYRKNNLGTQYEARMVYSAFYAGVSNNTDGDDVGLHETMHILDFLNKKDDGLPIGMSNMTENSYKTERDNLFSQYRITHASVGSIRTYGFANSLEFLSVITENFYEKPSALNSTSTSLYTSLAQYFNV